jgi:hypothetical protein
MKGGRRSRSTHGCLAGRRHDCRRSRRCLRRR